MKKPSVIILALLLAAFGIGMVFLTLMNKNSYQDETEMLLSNWYAGAFICVCISLIFMSSYMDDYSTKWNIYCEILPVKTGTRVASGFVFAAIVNVISAILASFEPLVHCIAKNCFSLDQYIFGITTLFCAAQFIISIYLIFTMIFKKYSIFALMGVMFLLGLSFGSSNILFRIDKIIQDITEYLSTQNLFIVSLAELVFIAALTALLHFITVFICKNINKWLRAIKNK
ncbi:MAG: ABC-2 transporter permease [Clostridia bacterium]|nr:ABC-2 transporter permease [Clostridia bacterium]